MYFWKRGSHLYQVTCSIHHTGTNKNAKELTPLYVAGYGSTGTTIYAIITDDGSAKPVITITTDDNK